MHLRWSLETQGTFFSQKTPPLWKIVGGGMVRKTLLPLDFPWVKRKDVVCWSFDLGLDFEIFFGETNGYVSIGFFQIIVRFMLGKIFCLFHHLGELATAGPSEKLGMLRKWLLKPWWKIHHFYCVNIRDELRLSMAFWLCDIYIYIWYTLMQAYFFS